MNSSFLKIFENQVLIRNNPYLTRQLLNVKYLNKAYSIYYNLKINLRLQFENFAFFRNFYLITLIF
jgi:hypothetical protein